MPDDKEKVVVTEQDEDTEITPESSDDLTAFFKEASGKEESSEKADDEKEEEEDKEKETEEEKKSEEGAKKKEEKGEEEKKSEEETKKKEEKGEEEEDEAVKRGKELLEAEKEAAKEAEEAQRRADEEAEKAKRIEEATQVVPLDGDTAKLFTDMIPDAMIPEDLKIGDNEVELKEFLSDNPEIQIISALQTREMLQRLIDNGVLMTVSQHQAALDEVRQELVDELITIRVEQAIPEAEEIISSEAFKKWFADVKEEDRVLFRSLKASDHILGLKKFIKDTNYEKAKEEVDKAKAKARKEKDEHDELHSTTIRPKKTTTIELSDEDFGDAFKEAADEIGKEV
jgi:hypothetical protein